MTQVDRRTFVEGLGATVALASGVVDMFRKRGVEVHRTLPTPLDSKQRGCYP